MHPAMEPKKPTYWAGIEPIPGVPSRDYPLDWNRILSGLLAVAWLVICAWAAGYKGLVIGFVQIGVPVACVWCPEEMGSLATSLPSLLSVRPISRPSPAGLVRGVAWVTLLTLTVVRPVVVYLML